MSNTSRGGRICAIVDCHNSQRTLDNWKNSVCPSHKQLQKECPCLTPFSLHSFPKDSTVRQLWVKAVNRKDFLPKDHHRVCSAHFVDGKPTKAYPVPQLHLGYKAEVKKSRRPLVRQPLSEKTSTLNFNTENIIPTDSPQQPQTVYTAVHISQHASVQTDNVQVKSVSTQTNDEVFEHSYAASKPKENLKKSCGTQASSTELSADSINTNSDSMFYTGLSLSVYRTLLNVMEKHGKKLPYRLPIKDQILLTLVRLRLALPLKDLARRFGISRSLTSSIFSCWITILAKHLKDVISWLPRDTIRSRFSNLIQRPQ